MGVVYLAHEPSLDRVVAVKVLAPHLAQDAAYVKRLVREARAAAQLDHPNIVHIYSIGEQDGLHFIAMQYVRGLSLARLIRQKGPLDLRQALKITSQTAEALAEAHRQGIIHRDIKPDNVMIDKAGSVKVMDFGLARAASALPKLTADGAQLGTPMYMSPEQVHGEPVDVRTDIYSLGITLYEMLAGRPPFDADTPIALMYQVIHGPLPILTDFSSTTPAPILHLLKCMTAKQREARYESMDRVLEELNTYRRTGTAAALPGQGAPESSANVLAGPDARLRNEITGVQALPPETQEAHAAKRLWRTRPVWAIAAGTVLLAAVLLTSWFAKGSREEGQNAVRTHAEPTRWTNHANAIENGDAFDDASGTSTTAPSTSSPLEAQLQAHYAGKVTVRADGLVEFFYDFSEPEQLNDWIIRDEGKAEWAVTDGWLVCTKTASKGGSDTRVYHAALFSGLHREIHYDAQGGTCMAGGLFSELQQWPVGYSIDLGGGWKDSKLMFDAGDDNVLGEMLFTPRADLIYHVDMVIDGTAYRADINNRRMLDGTIPSLSVQSGRMAYLRLGYELGRFDNVRIIGRLARRTWESRTPRWMTILPCGLACRAYEFSSARSVLPAWAWHMAMARASAASSGRGIWSRLSRIRTIS